MTLATWIRRVPWSLIAPMLLLLAFGWVGIARSEELAESSGRFLKLQMVWSALGLLAMVATTLPNYRILCRQSYPAFVISLGLLLAVYLFPSVNGAQRWIRFGPIGLQPSEFAKLAFVLALARYLMYRENLRRLSGLMAPLALAIVPMLLVLKEPDLGTALVFLPVLFAMLFAAGTKVRDLAIVALGGLLLMPILWSQMSREQRSRLTAMLEQTGPGEKPTGDGYHLHQAQRMLALGGVWGSAVSGDVADDRAAYRVPEPHTDSIFSVVTERLGLVGAATLLGLYLFLVWRGLIIAGRTREPYGKLVAVGVTSLIGVQAIINMGMMVGLLPITGLALPLVSYGGSSLLANSLAIGLLLNIGLRPGYEVANDPFRYSQ